jgi:2-oxoglutarate ferredoxin oxidoreductase subunit delta
LREYRENTDKGATVVANVTILAESCKGVEDCALCLEVCPKNLFAAADKANSRGYLPSTISDQSACTGCRACMFICPDFAIVVEKGATSKEESDG